MERNRLTIFTCIGFSLWLVSSVGIQSGQADGVDGPEPPAERPPVGPDAVETGDDSPDEADVEAYDADADFGSDIDFAWRKVAGHYVDPTSSYSLHGYVDSVFAARSSDWTAPDPTRPQPPGHLLIPNRDNAAFQYDAAVVLSSNLGAGHMMMELHLVSNPSGTGDAGPGGLTLAATEVTVSVDVHPTLLTVTGGIFWVPFGIVNRDWLGAEALFTALPRATSAFPAHWNERGVRLNGARGFGSGFGANYVISVGNGIHSFDVGGQPSADLDSNKTAVARIGVFPGLGRTLELGVSVAYGDLRTDGNVTLEALDARRYPAALVALGGDAVLKLGNLLATGYYIFSTESLDPVSAGDPSPADLRRQGATAQVIYDIPFEYAFLSSVAPKLRADWVAVDTLTSDGLDRERFASAGVSAGVNLYPHKQILRFDEYPFRALLVSLEYHLQHEFDGSDLANNRFVARITGRF